MNTVLYIIGNGFDIYHGMKTSYADFCIYVEENHSDLGLFLENYFKFQVNDKYLWNNFESDLGTFNYKGFMDDNCDFDIMDENFRPRDCYCLEDDVSQQIEENVDEIKETFSNWLHDIDYPHPSKGDLKLNKDATFLSFNYTHTLFELYSIPKNKVTHIHNSLKEYSNDLIFGHNLEIVDEPELDENGDSNRTMFTDSENASKSLLYSFKKPTEKIIKENCDFFISLSKIDTIYILGHSINDIDLPYFEQINKVVKQNTNWTISYYNDDEPEKMRNALKNIGIVSNISFIKLKDLSR